MVLIILAQGARMNRRTLSALLRPSIALMALAVVCAPAPIRAQSGSWSYFGADRSFTRYAPIDQIDASNVDALRVAWTRPGADPSYQAAFEGLTVSSYLRSTPVEIDGVLYAPNGIGLVEAFDPGTGETVWLQQPFEPTLQEARGRSTKGIDAWSDGSRDWLVVVREPWLYVLDRATGSFVESFGDGGRVMLTPEAAEEENYRASSGPIVVGDVIVVAGIVGSAGDSGNEKEATPEDLRGYDVRTGRLVWTFHVVPREGELGNDTWGDGSWAWSGDLGSWCCLSADEELGLVYVPFSAPTAAYYGGHRPGWNLFSNSLVAIDARTGERAWHFQMVHHDLWEYDTVGPPTLGTISVDGRRIDAVMQPSKTGFVYVFDRATGEPVWPIEERPVPQSTVPGEVSSPTQPFPTKPPPFGAQGVSVDDLIDFTPELRARAVELIEPFRTGPIFTPPSLYDPAEGGKKGTLGRPGTWGSGNWHTGAFDPETGYYYAVSHQLPDVFSIVSGEGGDGTMDYYGDWNEETEVPRIDGLPIFKPPWGRITAIDMNRGEHAWVAANGDGPRDHPLLEGLDIPPLGVTGRGAPLVTRSLLFSGEGGDAVIGTGSDGWGTAFMAFDKRTGERLWETDLAAGVTAAPMTYVHDGKQYIVVAIGGGDHEGAWVALALDDAR